MSLDPNGLPDGLPDKLKEIISKAIGNDAAVKAMNPDVMSLSIMYGAMALIAPYDKKYAEQLHLLARLFMRARDIKNEEEEMAKGVFASSIAGLIGPIIPIILVKDRLDPDVRAIVEEFEKTCSGVLDAPKESFNKLEEDEQEDYLNMLLDGSAESKDDDFII